MSSAERTLLFAYGSNLSVRRLRARTPSARPWCVARLAGHALRFHKRGADGSGKADAFRTGRREDLVWGAVYSVLTAELPALDRAERGYDAMLLDVATRMGLIVPARVYLARHSTIDPTLRPFRWYHRYVREGARRHGLPPDHVARIARVRSIPDPDRERAERHRLTALPATP